MYPLVLAFLAAWLLDLPCRCAGLDYLEPKAYSLIHQSKDLFKGMHLSSIAHSSAGATTQAVTVSRGGRAR